MVLLKVDGKILVKFLYRRYDWFSLCDLSSFGVFWSLKELCVKLVIYKDYYCTVCILGPGSACKTLETSFLLSYIPLCALFCISQTTEIHRPAQLFNVT
jgi:hypothetical protein